MGALALLVAGPAHAGRVRVGDPLPALELTGWTGAPVPASSLRGRVVALDFWATWCPVCRAALPALDAIGRRFEARGLTVVAISVDRDPATADRYLSERLPDHRLTLVRDTDQSVMSRLGAEGMPALFVVDRGGVVRIVEGGYEESSLPAIEARIEKLLDEPAPAAEPTPPH